MMHISDFQTKNVINVSDGTFLGNIDDLDINVTTGKIQSVIITNQGKVLGLFGRGDELIIPWRNIVKIGKDVILVRIQNDVNKIEES